MATNVTVLGVGSTVTIPINSNAAASLAQNALGNVSAAITAGLTTPVNYTGTVPATSGNTELVFSGASAQSATIPASATFGSLVSNATAPLTITDAATNATTVVSGSGGLTFTQTAPSVTGSMIVSGGGTSSITLATGANTVSVDTTSTTSAVVNALAGKATVIDNANPGAALLALAGSDTSFVSGTAFVFLGDSTSTVSILSGGAGFVAGASESITSGAGNITVAAVSATGSPATETIVGATSTVSGGNVIYVAAVPTQTVGSTTITGGNLFINPNVQNVTVFAGAGATTLFGVGDFSGAANSGSDVVSNGIGYFHAGSGGGSLLETALSVTGAATTLVGGGANDVLYAQSANVSLKGSAGTSLIDAGGITISGGVVKLGTGAVTTTGTAGQVFSAAGAAGGVTISAGASNSAIFGATSGGNTIISGTGNSTVFGHAGASGGTGNTYLEGGVGSMTITDFTSIDTFKLNSGVTAAVSGSGASTLVTLSDGTKITVANGFITSSNVGTYFHS